ncbi:MAG TPA: rhodanese-like domain-containing protein [Flavobacteriales bacterium]|nr:rhodanese-like domain-containing protein [Flavobacteriales bacterium]
MRARFLSILLTLAPFIGAAQSSAPTTSGSPTPADAQPEVKELSPAQLSAMLGTPNLFIFDCNEPDMFAEAHVPGARPTVYDAVTVEMLPTDPSAVLVFYCYSPECPAATYAAHTATTLGYTDVHCMIAGITGWQDAGLPTEP